MLRHCRENVFKNTLYREMPRQFGANKIIFDSAPQCVFGRVRNMKILVVSDTHRNYGALEAIIRKNPDADMLIHLGDGEHEFDDASHVFPQFPMVYVGGNCDYGFHKTTHIVDACGQKIFCCHGHTVGVRMGISALVNTAKQNGCNIALYGHTHVYLTEVSDGVYVMNPGSPDCPRGGNKPSYGVIELDNDGGIKMNIITLEKK